MSRHIGNGALHLSNCHSLTEKSEVVKERQKSGTKQTVLQFTPCRFSAEEIEAIAIAEGMRPFSIVEGCFFRRAFHPKLLTGEAVRKVTLQLAEKLREEVVGSLKGSCVTLAFDSGTVWHRYFAVVLKKGSLDFLLGAVSDEEFENKKITSAAVGTLLQNLVGDLASRGVRVVALVADNASNFQAVDVQCKGTVHLRCAAHVLQLCAKDLLEGDCAQAVEAGNFLLARHSFLPTPCITRWNSTFRLWEAISRRRGEIATEADMLEKILLVEQGIAAMKPFALATMLVQRDDATLFEHILAIQMVKDAEIIQNRKEKLSSTAIALVAFFFPNAKRQLLSQKLLAALRECLCSLRELAEASRGKESLEDNVEQEWLSFTLAPPMGIQGKCSLKSFLDFWKENVKRFPRIATIVTSVIGATPSEASVERVFSRMKFTVNKQRTTMESQAVNAQLIVNSALHFEEASKNSTHNIDAEEGFVQPATIDWILLCATPKENKQPQGTRRRTRNVDDICSVCERYFEDHELQESVHCESCDRWVALYCVGIPAHMLTQLTNLRAWVCPKCR
jgi:hypothetical protein